MRWTHFSFVTDNVILFPVKQVPGHERIAYVDSAMDDYEEVWRTMHTAKRQFSIVMDISALRTSHPQSRDHMIARLKRVHEAHPGTWVAVAIVASSVLTRGIATVYLWAADTFSGVSIKVFSGQVEAIGWAKDAVKAAAHPP